jgi:VanZ family protein
MTDVAKANTLTRMPELISPLPAATTPAQRSGGHASASVRIALVFYLVLVIYASCYPFSGWRDNGLLPWSYLSETMPHYWTAFDLVVNVLGYVPLGVLAVLAMYPQLRGANAILLASASGALLAALLECLQTYLSSRVPSTLDLITNASGVMIGAVLGELLVRPVLERSWLRSLRSHWFSDQASRGLIVIALWPLAQIYPQPYLFGHGQWLPTLSQWLSGWLDTPVDIGNLLWSGIGIDIDQFLVAEVVITALGMSGAVLTMLCQTRNQAPRAILVVALLAAAIGVKALAHAVLFTPSDAFSWLTPAAVSGLLVGAVMLVGLSFAPPIAQRRAAIASLAVCLLLLNALPSNPYFLSTLSEWVQGKFLNFNGAAQFLSLCWPVFALWFLLHPTHRES